MSKRMPHPSTRAATLATSTRRSPPRRGPRIAYLEKRTALQAFVEGENQRRLSGLLKRRDVTVARMQATHDSHVATAREVLRVLEAVGALVTDLSMFREDVRADDFDLCVTVGGDGTLLRASHSIHDVPILGINSAPLTSVGFFCGADRSTAQSAIEAALRNALPGTKLARMKVTVAGKIVANRVLNDALFCHASPAATSRYILQLDGVVEEQKSSGFWIGPAAGSTAAQLSAGGKVLPLQSRDLQLVVREPYAPHGERYTLRRVLIRDGERLIVRSKMRSSVLFFDGPDERTCPRFGDQITFAAAKEPLLLLGVTSTRKKARIER